MPDSAHSHAPEGLQARIFIVDTMT